MKFSTDFPPNIEEVREAFPLSGKEIFTWGDTIFNPNGNKLPAQLIAHEEVHERQQGMDPDLWWKRYIKNPAWRLEQELEAHQVEYRVYCRTYGDRNRQWAYLREISKRLASPMYGNMVTTAEAMKLIRGKK